MANTLIQVKRSTSTNQPGGGSLSAGEMAYSYSSNVLFIGSSGGNDVLAIGGKYYIDLLNTTYVIAQSAFNSSNSASMAQSAFGQANAAFAKANSANYYAYLVDANATAAFIQANNVGGAVTTSNLIATSAFAKANSANYYAFLIDANTTAAFTQANNVAGAVTTSNLIATSAFTQANNVAGAVTTANLIATSAFAKANAANLSAGSAFDSENITRAIAVAAFGNSNTKFSSSGGTINGDVNITGNLSLTGSTTFINVASYVVNDPLLYIAGNNYTSDIVDIGFVANYNNGACSTIHTGVFRDAGTKEWYVFEGYDKEPTNNVIDPAGNNFTISILNATLRTSNIILGGINALSWITNAYNTANIAVANVNYVNTAMQTAYGLINNHSGAITTANNTAIAAFLQANNVGGAVTTANLIATSAFAKANSANYYAFLVDANSTAAFTQANNVGGAVTTANLIATSAFTKANSANYYAYLVDANATAAFTQANAVAGAVTTANLIATSAFAKANLAASTINASNISSGTLVVAYGGTGVASFTNNGIVFGNTSGPLRVTAAGTEGQVLQATSTGVPNFAMLDGGSF